jgi:hypothetical protein
MVSAVRQLSTTEKRNQEQKYFGQENSAKVTSLKSVLPSNLAEDVVLEYLSMMPSIVTNIQAYEKLAGNKVCYEM